MPRTFVVAGRVAGFFLWVFVMLAPFGAAQAQVASLKRADSYYESEDYHTALQQYELLLKDNPQSGIAMFKAGVCYLYVGMPEHGLTNIRQARYLPLEIDPYYYFWLGKAYHLNMKIDSAIINYRKYLKTASPQDAFRKGTQNLIAQAHRTESYFTLTDNNAVQMRNLGDGINSPYTERNPQLSSDGKLMVFTSRRPLYPEEEPLADGEFVEKSFVTARQPDGSWGKAQPILVPADRKSWFTALQLLEGGQKLLLLKEGKNSGFFIATRKGDSYENVLPLDLGLKVSETDYDVSFSANLRKAVFSKMNRTTGDLDLYIIQKDTLTGAWTKPTRMSPAVNSMEDEVSPELSEEGNLLMFATKGREGLGGFDVFKTEISPATRKWTQAENIGMPYNSPGNEIGYEESTAPGQKYIYIASSRARGLGEADIYEVNIADVKAEK